MAALDRSKFATDLLAISQDMQTVLAKARDLDKRFNDFSDEVNALATAETQWNGTVFDKDRALDGMVMVRTYIKYVTNQALAGGEVRDNENTMARLENLQSS